MAGSSKPQHEKPKTLAEAAPKTRKTESEQRREIVIWLRHAAFLVLGVGLWWASAQIWIYLDVHRPRTPHWPNSIPWMGHTRVFYANGFELLFMIALDVAALIAAGYGFSPLIKQPPKP